MFNQVSISFAKRKGPVFYGVNKDFTRRKPRLSLFFYWAWDDDFFGVQFLQLIGKKGEGIFSIDLGNFKNPSRNIKSSESDLVFPEIYRGYKLVFLRVQYIVVENGSRCDDPDHFPLD